MSKRNRNLLVLVVIALVVVLLLVFAMNGIRYGINRIVPLRSEFKRGADYGIVRTAVYQITEESERTEANQSKIVETMTRRIEEMNVDGVRIYPQGKDRVRIDIPRKQHAAILSETGLQEEIYSFLHERAYLQMLDAEGNVVYDSSHIINSEVVPMGTSVEDISYGILIELNDKGAEQLYYATESATPENTMVFTLMYDEETLAAPEITEPITSGGMIFQNNMEAEYAYTLATLFNLQPLAASITQEFHFDGDPLQGAGIFNTFLTGIGAALLVVILVWVLLYKASGAMAALSLAFTYFLFMLGYATIESVLFTPAGLVGFLAALVLAIGFHAQVLETLNKNLYSDQDVLVSIKSIFRRGLAPVVDCMLLLYLTGIVGILFSGEIMKDFFITLLVGGSFALLGYFLFSGLLVLMAGVDGKQSHYKRLGSALDASVRGASA